jgi:peptidoglycan hydrolase CwlO-like protein
MNKILKAADEVKKLHRMFAALGDVIDVLDRVGSLEQAESEAQARIDKLNAEAKSLGKRIDEATAEAARILEVANEQATSVRLAVEKQNAEAIAAARAKADEMEARATAIIDRAKAEADAMHAKACEAADSVTRAQEELAAIEKKIDDARARIAKMLGD